jgi:response regulator RpfG family c-di-GMP phosphodiesterase
MNKAVLSLNINKTQNALMNEIISERFDLVEFTNVFEATTELKKRKDIEVIIVDMEHSDVDYLNFVYHIKTSKFYNKPMLILTSYHNSTVNDRLKDVQVECLIYKPFSPMEVIRFIEKTLLSK